MIRFTAAAALFITALVGTAATAQGAGYYTATPVTAPSKASFMARETVWTARDVSYTARRGDDRDSVQCELVVRQAGKLSAFTAGGAAFDAAALDKCNAKAR